MRVLETTITIDAPAHEVWKVLTDFAGYPDWNPFITSITGVAEPGQRLAVDLNPPGGRAIRMKPHVRVVEANRRFTWLGHLGVPHIFDGEHEFVMEPTNSPNATVFTQRETFRGALVPFTGRLLARTKTGFDAMNAALKRRVEAR